MSVSSSRAMEEEGSGGRGVAWLWAWLEMKIRKRSSRVMPIEMDEADEATQRQDNLLPGLPDDVALLCLARLPLGFLGVARTISKAWSEALQPSCITKLRLHAGIKCELVFLFVSKQICGIPNERCLLVIDPSLFTISAIPCPDCLLNSEVQFEMISGVCGEVLWMGRDTLLGSPLPQIFVLDYLRSRWRSLSSMAKLTGGRAGLVTATIEGVAYFAGGWRDGILTAEAECLDLSTKRWSSMPDRHFLRVYGKGVAMDGKFLVFAGLPHSNPAEQCYPELGQWQIVEDVWAKDLKTKSLKMVMVEGCLYAINSENVIMKFQPLTKSWVNLGGIATSAAVYTYVHSLLGVGAQLWSFLFEIESPSMLHHETMHDRGTNSDHYFLGIYAAQLDRVPIRWERLPFCIEGLQQIISAISFNL